MAKSFGNRVRAILRFSGHEVIEASDGESAIDIARTETPDLILMDVQLPRMSGLEAAGVLKGDPQTQQIPVVAMTAYALRGDREKILESGCDGYVSKPIDTRTLPGVLAEYLGDGGSDGESGA